MNLEEQAGKLKTDIPAVFLAIKKKETPIAAKVIAGLAVAYAVSPIDLIPDFIPILAYVDDIILLPLLVAFAVKMVPPGVFETCREEARELWPTGKFGK